ncbi:MAG TPA: ATP-binding protein [Herpetosiphonaceae bacterium]
MSHEPHPDQPISDRDLQPALEAVVLDSLRPASAGLAAIYVLFAASHLALLPPAAAPIMASLAGGTALLLAALRVGLGRRQPPTRLAHPLAIGVLLLVLINSLAHIALLAEPQQTTNIGLLIIGAGCLVLSARWLNAVTALAWLSWGAIVAGAQPSPLWLHFIFMLLGATLLSQLVHLARVRTFRRLERARRMEADQRRELGRLIEESRRNELRFRQLAEAADEGVLIIAGEHIMAANSTAGELWGYDAADLAGKRLGELVAPVCAAEAEAHLAAASGELLETLGQRKDGMPLPLRLRCKPLQHAGSQARVVTVRDMTERLQALAELRSARDTAEAANRAKNEFLANMSHELRTPLNAIIGYSDLLVEDARDLGLPDFAEPLAHINQAGHHLLKLINDVLNFSRLEAGDLRLTLEALPVETLVEAAAAAARPWIEKNQNRFIISAAPKLGTMSTDGGKLRQVLLHGLRNAATFTSGGSVTLGAWRERRGTREWIIFEIADTGIGMSEEQQARVFEHFTQADGSSTRRYGGMGLGLALSQRLCRLLGGVLSLRSAAGVGTALSIAVPATLDGQHEDEGLPAALPAEEGNPDANHFAG